MNRAVLRIQQFFTSLLLWSKQRGLRARFLLLFYGVTLFSVSVVGYFGFTSASRAYHSKASELVSGYTAEVSNKIDTFQKLVRNDLFYIGNNTSLLRYLYWQDLHDSAQASYWQGLTIDLMRQFATTYSYHYKIRFVGTDGNDVFGVKRDLNTGKVQVLTQEELQNNQHKEFFIHSMKLAKGEYFVSAMTPNNERGQVERPIVPVVRFAMPVIGDNGVRYGVLVMSVQAEQYFSYLRDVNKIEANRQFYLVAQNGEYLFHPDKQKMFASLTGGTANFNADYHSLLKQVEASEAQFTVNTADNIFSFLHIHPNTGRHENGFILVGVAPESAVLAELNSFIGIFVLLLLVVVIAVLIASRYFVHGLMGPLEFVTKQMERLGRGETNVADFEYHSNDEIKRMLDTSRKLMSNMQGLANQADVISKGDFSKQVPLLSEQDSLGSALNNMTQMLRLAKDAEQRRNWLKDGINQLNEALTGDLTPQQLADTAISLAGHYLEAGRGVFYRYLKDTQQLELLGSYMYVEREALSNCFKLGEGAIGQSARERKPIILHDANDAAAIVTGTLHTKPHHTYTYPLLHEGELLGVIELATLMRLDELQQEFINRASEVMASFLYIVEQHEQIKRLLEVSEQATRAAQEQSSRLQQANAQMETQQRQLQQQAEELQLSNTQMEEQQQQLRQQTEELQASNAQMEEQQQQLRQQAEELQESNAQMEEQQQQMVQQAVELERKNSELNASRDALDQRAKDLELASKYKSEFLANMSHELRTPLNSIILLSKMLAMNEEQHLSEEEIKRASIVHKAGEELLRLINDILDLSKIEAGKMEVRAQTLASRDLLSEFSDLFSATAQQKGLAFNVEDLVQNNFVSDRDKLSQIVRNLLSNAFKFTKQGQVTLRFERSERANLPLKISVTDTGVGIPKDKQQLVFEAFQQVDGSISREYGGTGLGLTISRRYAELLGGVLEVHSELGKGSQFCLYLPVALPEVAQASGVVVQPVATSSSASIVVHDDRTNLKTSDAVILVIDDDSVFCEAVMLLNKRLGYKTLVAHSGQEGLRMAKTYRPRGILLDLGLPDLNGSEVLHQIKSDRDLRQIPVYIVSAQDKDQVVLQDGVAGYLQKPVNDAQLENAESEVLKRATQSASHVLLLEGIALSSEELAQLLQNPALEIHVAHDLNGAQQLLREQACQLAIIDLSQNAALPSCRALREINPELPLILYSNQSLGADQEAALRPYTDSIIVKAAKAHERMLENVQRFLQQVPQRSHLAVKPNSNSKKLQGHHILVVDDDPRNLFVITSALEQQGAQVGNALSGTKGLSYLRSYKVDLVFMDIMMPEMDGYEVIRQIRADANLKNIPIVALTAKALKADRQKALESGANDYLSKPVDYEVLVNMAKIWCEEAGKQ